MGKIEHQILRQVNPQLNDLLNELSRTIVSSHETAGECLDAPEA